VAAVISHPEQRDTTHTNTFRCVACRGHLLHSWLLRAPLCGVDTIAG
jgi:hypothetical protein